MKKMNVTEMKAVRGGWATTVLKIGVPLLGKALKCNRYTNWGRNGKSCICGLHWF